MNQITVSVSHLIKMYGRNVALWDISFELYAGEIVGFLGPNGAGKSTTLKIIAGILGPTGGQVSVCGFDVLKESLEVRKRIGYLPETVWLYPEMRVIEYLRYRAVLKGLNGNLLKERVNTVIEECGLKDVRRSLIGKLSKGYRQRIAIADALLAMPKVLLLDEPTIGLDPSQIIQTRELIKSLSGRCTVFFSSHILSEVEQICDRILIVHKGKLIESGRPEDLLKRFKSGTGVIAEIKGNRNDILAHFTLSGCNIKSLTDIGDGWIKLVIGCDSANQLAVKEELYRRCTVNGFMLRELRSERGNLEEIFLELTKEEEL